MTTEEMNREIVAYMGKTGQVEDGRLWDGWLISVWGKLRGELAFSWYKDGRDMDSQGAKYINELQELIKSDNITAAHQLIHAAIVWLKSK